MKRKPYKKWMAEKKPKAGYVDFAGNSVILAAIRRVELLNATEKPKRES